MAAKPKQKITQPELIEELCEAGYTLDGFSRKGDSLVIRLMPADLIKHEQHVARAVCDVRGVPVRCNVFAQVPQDLFIVTVKLPEDDA